jgi:phage replication-related protein YjqB (UPF0714/DUF867 family)
LRQADAVLAELLEHAGVTEELVVGSRFGLMAFHGGNLERGTDDIATAAAERAGASLYAVRQPPNLRWHIPSLHFQPEASERLAAFLDHVEVAVAVHGYGREGMWTTLLLGGRNRGLASTLAAELLAGLGEGFTVLDDLDAIPSELRGVHPRNPVNRPPEHGVQLELPPRVRRHTGVPTFDPRWEEAIVEALCRVAAAWSSASSPNRSKARPTTTSSLSPALPSSSGSTPSSDPITT